MTADIFLVGVGGQGIITASRIIGEAAMTSGKHVLLSETHGMAQRGGAVSCTARIDGVNSPLIPDGEADAILSLELLETLRALPKASKKTIIISSTERILPPSASSRESHYPTQEEVGILASQSAARIIFVDAKKFADEAGAPMSSNVVMIGALAGTGVTGIGRSYFETALQTIIPRLMNENLEAFSKGYEVSSPHNASR